MTRKEDYVDDGEQGGDQALSMPKLGAELGVQSMSLYSHVESKDALLDGIVKAMSAKLELLSAGERTGRKCCGPSPPRSGS